MTDHASHLCVRSSHQAIHYASALVSAVASAASCFFSSETSARSLSPRIPQNWAEPEECGRRRANIGWSAPRLPHSLNPLQVSKCVHNCRSVNCCWNASWIPSGLHTKLLLLLVCERRCGRRCSPSVPQMTKTCNSLLCTANGSLSM